MDNWQTILERFLRNESSEQENKIVFHALRDGWIDEEFKAAIDRSLSETDHNFHWIHKKTSEQMLQNIRQGRTFEKSPKPKKQLPIIRELLKIAAVVLVTLSVGWWYHTSDKAEPSLAMNTIRVPAGQTVNLTLSDGTNIWLNAHTEMTYPAVFGNNRRAVTLDGEAYFEVAADEKKPFVVHTGEYDIQVLGTRFNVESYAGSGDFVTSLLQGSVRVIPVRDTTHALTLQPNTLARLHNGKLITKEITDFNHYRWREGLISFNNMSFTDLMVNFEKCYGIQIIVENKKARDYICTGKFRQSDGVDYALRVLQRDVSFKYVRDEDTQTIYVR